MESESAGKPKLRRKPCTLFCDSGMLISNIKKKNVRNAKLSQEPSQGAAHVAVCWEISCCDGFLLDESLFTRARTKPNSFDAAAERQDKKHWFHFKPEANLK